MTKTGVYLLTLLLVLSTWAHAAEDALHGISSSNAVAKRVRDTVEGVATLIHGDSGRGLAMLQDLDQDSTTPKGLVAQVLTEIAQEALAVPCDEGGYIWSPRQKRALAGQEYRAQGPIDPAEQTEYGKKRKKILCGVQAIRFLGELGCKSASTFVAGAARTTPNRVLRERAVQAVMQIGNTNVMDFAKEVIGDHEHALFCNQDRFIAYQQLIYYLNSDSAKVRTNVLEFLMNAAVSEVEFYDEAQLVDTTLCSRSEAWKNSMERMAWLDKSEGKGLSLMSHWEEQRRALRALPESERTHVEVHPLRSLSPVLASPPQPHVED